MRRGFISISVFQSVDYYGYSEFYEHSGAFILSNLRYVYLQYITRIPRSRGPSPNKQLQTNGSQKALNIGNVYRQKTLFSLIELELFQYDQYVFSQNFN